MSEPEHERNAESAGTARRSDWRRAVLERHRWLVFLLPLVVFMLVGSLEPGPPAVGDSAGWLPAWMAIPYQYYPWVYTIKLVLTCAAVVFVLPEYKEFPFRVSPLAILVGVAGIVVWVGLCSLGLEQRLLGPLGLGRFVELGTRPAFNPFKELRAYPAYWAWGFLAVRFFGLVVVVAVIEEFFLRGFVMRFMVDADWWAVPFGTVTVAAVLAGTVVPMLMHPAELFAAAAWFSLITVLMIKTRNIWDCIVAHAITNFLLGVYVVFSNEWHLM